MSRGGGVDVELYSFFNLDDKGKVHHRTGHECPEEE
jgi:uncharacterized protein YdaU (DUF1376 family)